MNALPVPPAQAADLPPVEGVTPVMAQFLTAKASQPDAILFFRMGDFYELFFRDAEIAAAALGITLTKRGKHQGQDIWRGLSARASRRRSANRWKIPPRRRSGAPRPSFGATSCGW
jgi:hypothetical protein